LRDKPGFKEPSKPPPLKAAPPDLDKRPKKVEAGTIAARTATASSTSAVTPKPPPPPLRKAAAPAAVEAPPAPAAAAAAVAEPPAVSGGTNEGAAVAAAPEDAEDSDFDDMDHMDLGAALAARLEKKEESAKASSPDKSTSAKPADSSSPVASKAKNAYPDTFPVPGRTPGCDDAKGRSNAAPAARPKKDGAPPVSAGNAGVESAAAPPTAKVGKAGWGAPPPLAARGTKNGAAPKAAPVVPKEPPPPPLFDQWLAVLKFLTGWNDQRSYTTDEIKGALCEHLTEEGIQGPKTTQQLCATIVPLLSDLRRTDVSVMKNVKKDILKGFKIIQIYILRIVAFELIRERDTKWNAAPDAPPRKKGQPKEGAPYLSGDISTLAKTVQHFRFDSAFSGGLQKLIVNIRESKPKPKPVPKEKKAETEGNADSKKSAESAPKKPADAETGGASGTKRKADDSADEKSPASADATTREKGSDGKNSAAPPVAKKSAADGDAKPAGKDSEAPAGKSAETSDEKADKAAATDETDAPPPKRQRQMV